MLRHAILTSAALATLLLAGCGRAGEGGRTEAVTAPATPAATPAAAAPVTPVSAPAPVPANAGTEGIDGQVWQVRASSAVAVGTLYAFLPDGTLLIASPGSRLATGTWQRRPGGGITMVEESRPYAVDVLEASVQQLRLRSHNPGTPVDIALVPAPQPPQAVPPAFAGEWNARAADCGRAGTEARLRIEPGRIRLHESTGDLLAVWPEGERELALVARLSGEGQTRLAYRRYRLGAEGRSLTDVTDGLKGGVVRQRCG